MMLQNIPEAFPKSGCLISLQQLLVIRFIIFVQFQVPFILSTRDKLKFSELQRLKATGRSQDVPEFQKVLRPNSFKDFNLLYQNFLNCDDPSYESGSFRDIVSKHMRNSRLKLIEHQFEP